MLSALALLLALSSPASATEWQQPPQEVLDVLHAPSLPWVWTSPSGNHLFLADPVSYPPLEHYARGWFELAGVRVAPGVGIGHAEQGGTAPRVVSVKDGSERALDLPADAEVHDVVWTSDGKRFALTVEHEGALGVWVGDVKGRVEALEGLSLVSMLSRPVSWMPDQKRLLVHAVPEGRGAEPEPPAIPAGPAVEEGDGDVARSTYESRNLLKTAHDDALFDHYATSQLLIVDPRRDARTPLGEPDTYTRCSPSPDGDYLLVERLVGPWSHAVPWWRFASEVEVWDASGAQVSTVASRPLADQVPIQGVPEGARGVGWQATADHTLFWAEALDGGDPVAEATHRDRLMRLDAPFDGAPSEVWRATHRLRGWGDWLEDGTMVVTERERMKRWRYTHLLDVDTGTARPWYDRNEKDRYGSPGSPLYRRLDNGRWVLRQEGDAVYFSGAGATDGGDRPFVDLRPLDGGRPERLFRADPERYERFVAFGSKPGQFILRSESPTEVPNYHLATLGGRLRAAEGEATRSHTRAPITTFIDPTPQLRAIDKRIVRYERADGVPLSFQLYLPPGYQEGDVLPAVLYAYPLEYSDASTAGQVAGSTRRFERFRGSSHMFFLLQGYAVLHRTAMPMVGDPETVYDTFVDQLVADADAAMGAVAELGMIDMDRVGVIGHSHGGLMVGHLLAHTDHFAAGIARSGSYNKTMQPFGYQSERRTLFEARDAYIGASPTFVADQVDEPVLVIHGDADSNPGTLTIQSQVFFQAVRGAGGTTRLVLLPYEDHGYRARESIEHVLWEQLRWFDAHVKGE
jgi:dipeptidyl aminopeptidase/acylaminoacyl peptidase